MPNRQRNLGINIRVTPEEKKKIERNAARCRLTVSEYLRQLAMKKTPKELPAKEIEESFHRIGNVIDRVDAMKRSTNDPAVIDFCMDISKMLLTIYVETLQLGRHFYPKKEARSNGDH